MGRGREEPSREALERQDERITQLQKRFQAELDVWGEASRAIDDFLKPHQDAKGNLSEALMTPGTPLSLEYGALLEKEAALQGPLREKMRLYCVMDKKKFGSPTEFNALFARVFEEIQNRAQAAIHPETHSA